MPNYDDLRKLGGLWRYIGRSLTYDEIKDLYAQYYARKESEED